MPRWQPKYKEELQAKQLGENPVEILRRKIFQILNSHLGWARRSRCGSHRCSMVRMGRGIKNPRR